MTTEHPWQAIELKWNPRLHPRGPLGMFVEKEGIASTGSGQLPLFSRRGVQVAQPTKQGFPNLDVPPREIAGTGSVERGIFNQRAFDEAVYVPRGLGELGQATETVVPGELPTLEQREDIENSIDQMENWLQNAKHTTGQPEDVREKLVQTENLIEEFKFDLENNPTYVGEYSDEFKAAAKDWNQFLQVRELEGYPSSSSFESGMDEEDGGEFFFMMGGNPNADEVVHVTRGITDPIPDNDAEDYTASEIAHIETERASLTSQLRDLDYSNEESDYSDLLHGHMRTMRNEHSRLMEMQSLLDQEGLANETEVQYQTLLNRSRRSLTFAAGSLTEETDKFLDQDVSFVHDYEARLNDLRDSADLYAEDPDDTAAWIQLRAAHENLSRPLIDRASEHRTLQQNIAELPNPNARSIEANADTILQARLDGDTSPIRELMPVVDYTAFNAGQMADEVGLYKLEDGSKFVYKIDTPKSINNEIGSYWVGQAVGAPVPKTFKVSDTEQIQQLAPGKMAYYSEFANNYDEFMDHDDAQRIATMDYLTMNIDRHGQNWMYDDSSDRATPIDNGHAFGASGDPFVLQNSRGGMPWNDPAAARGFWGNTPMPDSEILREWGDNLTGLKDQFERAGLSEYWRFVMSRYERLAERVEEYE